MPKLLFGYDKIWKIYTCNLQEAMDKLAELEVFCNHAPHFAGLGGWVFEQTIQFCVRKELKARRIQAAFREQIPLIGRVKADLGIGNLAIEIKSAGLFSKEDANRYGRYKTAAAGKGLDYLFFTSGESCDIYREGIIKAVGADNVFFLDGTRDWGRFVSRIAAAVTKKG